MYLTCSCVCKILKLLWSPGNVGAIAECNGGDIWVRGLSVGAKNAWGIRRAFQLYRLVTRWNTKKTGWYSQAEKSELIKAYSNLWSLMKWKKYQFYVLIKMIAWNKKDESLWFVSNHQNHMISYDDWNKLGSIGLRSCLLRIKVDDYVW